MLKNLKNKKKKRGFTLIELIIVIAIIAILAVLAIPKFGEIKKDANFKSDIANAKTIANATTTLLAEGNTTLGTGFTVDDSEETVSDKRNAVENYLQNPPKPKSSGYSAYTVAIDSKQNVTVTLVNGDTVTKLFPVPDEEVKEVTATP